MKVSVETLCLQRLRERIAFLSLCCRYPEHLCFDIDIDAVESELLAIGNPHSLSISEVNALDVKLRDLLIKSSRPELQQYTTEAIYRKFGGVMSGSVIVFSSARLLIELREITAQHHSEDPLWYETLIHLKSILNANTPISYDIESELMSLFKSTPYQPKT